MRTILVPTDFSSQAGYALSLAAQIARQNDSKILLLHVVENYSAVNTVSVTGDMTPSNFTDDIYTIKLIETSKKHLEEAANDPLYSGVVIDTKIQVGNPYGSISSEVTENDVDLIVMGTTGVSGLDEVLIGSNTEKVVRHSKCPVLTVKNPVELDSLKEIVFATNFAEENKELIENLKKLQKTLDAKLNLLKVNTPNNFNVDRDTRKDINNYIEKYSLENYTVNIYNALDEEDGIIFFAEDINADLIAMGTHGRTGFLHLISGSIAEDVVNHASRPVWTYKVK
ncbi:universal stress protein [Aureibacter tunicatorum]|uniref:Nucleotide-binding universal stress UspA family protein n=1 Tax=Aureibacter tunicatorum TaxID=866807 RepID=A0AAE3XPS8_9BACT|nr:universal stress protein [Aureibacter tunicatorum]MDR6240902.1 nucleotide-binding universal stress UspA family protein [Aureibacter tunicatorum]BDD03682.1 universal stress protein UspA [Aureibacter tunicatorum]